MSKEFDNIRPIYIQIIEDLKLAIVSGEYKCGAKLPVVRTLAEDLRVNPNTVQRAYNELENEKLVYTDRTNGRYVTNDEELIKNMKLSIVKEKTEKFLNHMKSLGIEKKEIINYLKDIRKD